MIFGIFPCTPGGKQDTSRTGYGEGPTLMIAYAGNRPGVREIRVREAAGAFRVIYVASLPDVIYVLHAFQKKTRQTAKRDMDSAASRLREQMARIR